MKKFIGYILLTLVLVSCDSDGKLFHVEGRFRNFNQGELFVYSTDGAFSGIDTVKVFDGRFYYEVPLERPTTLMIIFPNYSQQPLFAAPGEDVRIQADASHLKEMKITGTDENELLTDFRMETSDKTPPEVIKAAEEFIRKNPKSKSALYLVDRHFVNSQTPDFPLAHQLVEVMLESDPDNGQAYILKQQLEGLKGTVVGARLPEFVAVGIDGDTITHKSLCGRVNIISLWATWNYDSQNLQNILRKLQKQYGDTVRLFSVNLDGNDYDCRRSVKRDSLLWPHVCDEQLWHTPLVRTLGFAAMPSNIIADSTGVILARDVHAKDIQAKVKDIMKTRR